MPQVSNAIGAVMNLTADSDEKELAQSEKLSAEVRGLEQADLATFSRPLED